MRHVVIFFVLALVAAADFVRAASIEPDEIPKLQHYPNVDPNSITVSDFCVSLAARMRLESPFKMYVSKYPIKDRLSGISSGGAMAVQFHFAHSAEVKGAGIFAGGPYMCAYGGFAALAAECMLSPSTVLVPRLITDTAILSAGHLIDDTSNLAGSRVYIWHGSKDSVVHQPSGKKMQEMYLHYDAIVEAEFSYEAEHGQPTDNYGGPCGTLNILQNFINNCHYMGAYEMLNYVYGGDLIRPNSSYVATGELLRYAQADFFILPPFTHSMDRTGFIYVPAACKDGAVKCKFHIAFHGCMANIEYVGEKYATMTGYVEAADLNNIIVLFPQVQATLVNPSACWDWFGYLGSLMYPTKDGIQILGVHRMMQRVIYG